MNTNDTQANIIQRRSDNDAQEIPSTASQRAEGTLVLSEKEKARFWSKVQVKSTNECWTWTGGLNNRGYGSFGYERKWYGAHVFSAMLHGIQNPHKLDVCHTCDNPSCVNPSHLFIATESQNMRDAARKGRLCFGDRNPSRRHPENLPHGKNHWTFKHPERRLFGERHPMVKLNSFDVKSIRSLATLATHAVIASNFGITRRTVGGIISRKTWKHI